MFFSFPVSVPRGVEPNKGKCHQEIVRLRCEEYSGHSMGGFPLHGGFNGASQDPRQFCLVADVLL